MKSWKNFGEMRQVFEQVREQVGEIRYLKELELASVQNPGQFQSATRRWIATGVSRASPRNGGRVMASWPLFTLFWIKSEGPALSFPLW